MYKTKRKLLILQEKKQREEGSGIMEEESKKESKTKTGCILAVVALVAILLAYGMVKGGGTYTEGKSPSIAVKSTTRQVPKVRQEKASVVKYAKAPSIIGKVKIRNLFEELRKEILSRSEWGGFILVWGSNMGAIRTRVGKGKNITVGRLFAQMEADAKVMELSVEMTAFSKVLLSAVLEVVGVIPEDITPAVRDIEIEGKKLDRIVNEMGVIADVYFEFIEAW